MKKLVMLCVMVLTLAISAVASAASGKVLDAEEAIVAKFIEGGNYKAITASLSAEMQQNWDEKAYTNMQQQVANNFGKLTTNKLRIIEKFDDADILTYQIVGEKIPAARFVYVFMLNGEKPLLHDFRILMPKAKEETSEAGK